MSYQLATSPDLYSLKKQQNVDEWKSASMQAQIYRSMEATCTGVWRTEVSQWGLGADTQGVWGHSTSLVKTQKQMQATRDVREGAMDVIVM